MDLALPGRVAYDLSPCTWHSRAAGLGPSRWPGTPGLRPGAASRWPATPCRWPGAEPLALRSEVPRPGPGALRRARVVQDPGRAASPSTWGRESLACHPGRWPGGGAVGLAFRDVLSWAWSAPPAGVVQDGPRSRRVQSCSGASSWLASTLVRRVASGYPCAFLGQERPVGRQGAHGTSFATPDGVPGWSRGVSKPRTLRRSTGRRVAASGCPARHPASGRVGPCRVHRRQSRARPAAGRCADVVPRGVMRTLLHNPVDRPQTVHSSGTTTPVTLPPSAWCRCA